MKVKIYVEGGGDGQALRMRCRHGFSQFFECAGLSGRMPAVVACGSRNDAFESYCTALASAGHDDFPMLLVDSEGVVSQEPWDHVTTRDHWRPPANSRDEHCHLMVQCMEAWFIADRDLLARFFGQGFASNPLPANQDIEAIPKESVFQSLRMATRNSRTKGEYDKSGHSFEILGQLDPMKVRRRIALRRQVTGYPHTTMRSLIARQSALFLLRRAICARLRPLDRHRSPQAAVDCVGGQVGATGPCNRAKLIDEHFGELVRIVQRLEDGAEEPVGHFNLACRPVVEFHMKPMAAQGGDADYLRHVSPLHSKFSGPRSLPLLILTFWHQPHRSPIR